MIFLLEFVCFSIFLEPVYFKCLCFGFRTKMMLNKLRSKKLG